MAEGIVTRRLDDATDLESAVTQAVGFASTCWENLDGTGTFEDGKAREIVQELLDGIREGRWRESTEALALPGQSEVAQTHMMAAERARTRFLALDSAATIADREDALTAYRDALHAARDALVRTRLPIDADPEFFHGLTMRADGFSAQVRDGHIVLAHQQIGEGSPMVEYEIDAEPARRLRDLLNIATARGYL